ncbi:MAG: hypothetical protein NPIRA04_13090 [Nitrospirales bacterium]|nr:MAG: hypothetical protein NPIRA04_13090 [Nitrospirales bacterium]
MLDDNTSTTLSILLVEDNTPDARMVQEQLTNTATQHSFSITHARTLREALTFLHTTSFHAILLDLNLPESNGMETLKQIRRTNASTPIVILTVNEDEPLALEAIKLGAQDYVPKSQMNSGLLPRTLHYAIERVRNDRVRGETERMYRLFVEGATGLAFILLDVNGQIIHWNEGAQRLFGYSDEEALNRYFSFLFPQEDQNLNRPNAELRRAEADEKGDDDNWLIRADGTRFWASGAVTAVRDSQEQLIGFAKVVRDKTSTKEANDKLAELNRTLEERVNTRTQELVRYQDRLRAMAAELTITEQRERRRLSTDLHDYLAQLLVVCRLKLGQCQSRQEPESIMKALREADDLLDQSLTYTRTLISQISPTCLYEFGLQASLSWLGSEMKNQGLTVHVHDENRTLSLREDHAVLIYQSVRELLFNVLKHSGVNEATLTVSIPNDTHLQIEVKDFGRGFPHLTEGDNHPRDKFGIFSIRERIEALGGKFLITSTSEDGSHVMLQIPLDEEEDRTTQDHKRPTSVPDTAASSIRESSRDTIRILIVDDHKMVREGFCFILNAQEGFEVVGEGENGEQAIVQSRSLQPDIIIMDFQMPNMDGLEATRRIIRERPETIVIGLSVYDSAEVAQWFLDAGAKALLTKGGPADNLINIIRQYASR